MDVCASVYRHRETSSLLIKDRVIHREDYHSILLSEARRLGAQIRLDANVTDISLEETKVMLSGGEIIGGDVIVGADGMIELFSRRLLVLNLSTQVSGRQLEMPC